MDKSIPAYDRIRAFKETDRIKISQSKKGIFLANDTYANMFLNLIFQKHGTFPSTYEIVGFDNSPIAKTTMDLLVRQMDEQKKRVPCSRFYDRILQDRLVFRICVSSCLIKDYNYTP